MSLYKKAADFLSKATGKTEREPYGELRLAVVRSNEELPLFDGNAPYRLIVVDYNNERGLDFFGEFVDPKSIEGKAPESVGAEISRGITEFLAKNSIEPFVPRPKAGLGSPAAAAPAA